MIGFNQNAKQLPDCKRPDDIHIGQPTLINCPKKDVWNSILSLYTSLSDETLPSSTEVLICCKSTTAEEFELLFRRAIQKPYHQGIVLLVVFMATHEIAGSTLNLVTLLRPWERRFAIISSA